MSSKFEAEKARVALLMRRLGLDASYPHDPNSDDESGADVVAVILGCRIGVQVTDLDTGETPGAARAAESKLAREAENEGTTYFTWGQNDPSKVIDAVTRSISRKARMSCAGFDEFWLLVCCGVPVLGAVGATFIVTQCVDTAALEAATGDILSASKYSRIFIHGILGTEEQTFYEWQRDRGWDKSIILPHHDEPNWDIRQAMNDPELLKDPQGWCDREIQKIQAEWQTLRGEHRQPVHAPGLQPGDADASGRIGARSGQQLSTASSVEVQQASPRPDGRSPHAGVE